MHKQIYLNIAVDDLERSKSFFASLGFTFEPKFTDQNAACMIVGENIFTMLLTKPFFGNFTTKPLADASKSTEALICLSCESRAEVDGLVAKALAAGGSVPRKPQDYGFMYSHGFEDLDGHIWELAYMDPNVPMPDQAAAPAAPDAR
ncbi:VOC family protein [Paraburkholderia sp. SOS3]|jgi:predicted lactoylglutathione lyase|uniref:VOC family protein n=1 Tax=Paraburkholderia sp. SOS3 TaxID=1926494 RepID=UPI00094772DF|nr:VOC family protein [Paraburkholderia sp. SOS3]APR38229.1 glyoxalase/bleomycin resistance/extradiol dioxygenase family protein [Paraburkholderia sp. SOS3]